MYSCRTHGYTHKVMNKLITLELRSGECPHLFSSGGRRYLYTDIRPWPSFMFLRGAWRQLTVKGPHDITPQRQRTRALDKLPSVRISDSFVNFNMYHLRARG